MLGSDEMPNTGITEPMENIESIVIHPFGNGLIVEIIGVGEKGDISIDSIEFDITGDDREVSARGDIPSNYKEDIRTALSKKRYSLVE
jgi:hypothetical protein